MSQAKVIYAHYIGYKLARTVVGLGLILAVIVGFITFSYQGHFFTHLIAKGGIWFPAFLLTSSGIVYFIGFEALLIHQMLFDHKIALWIENGTLVYLNRFYMSCKWHEVVAVKLGRIGLRKSESIVLSMRDGREKIIPSGAFAESREEILGKLKEAILVG